MNLTTIASLPSGGGCKSAMTAEVAEPVVMGMDPGAGDDQTSVGFYSFEEGGLVRIGPTFCDECDTCSHCLKNGCIPKVKED